MAGNFVVYTLLTGQESFNMFLSGSPFRLDMYKNAEIDSLTICFVADMHLNNFTSHRFLDDYIKQVSHLNPDIILYGGDMLERGRINEENMKAFDEKLSVLKPLYGKYIVGGNHDNYRRNGYDEDLDLFFMSDTVVKVANSLYLMGLRYRTSEKKQ